MMDSIFACISHRIDSGSSKRAQSPGATDAIAALIVLEMELGEKGTGLLRKVWTNVRFPPKPAACPVRFLKSQIEWRGLARQAIDPVGRCLAFLGSDAGQLRGDGNVTQGDQFLRADRIIKQQPAARADRPNYLAERIDRAAPQNNVFPDCWQVYTFQPGPTSRDIEKTYLLTTAERVNGGGQDDVGARICSSPGLLGIVGPRRFAPVWLNRRHPSKVKLLV